MFLAWETRPVTGGMEFRISILSPIRIGTVTYGYSIFFSKVFADLFLEGVNTPRGREEWRRVAPHMTMSLSPASCSVSKWASFYLNPYYNNDIWVAAFPMQWEDIVEPAPIAAFTGMSQALRVIPSAGIGGILPQLSLAPSTQTLRASPGQDIEVPFDFSLGAAGGSGIVTLQDATRDLRLNPLEKASLIGQFTMPALWPGETVTRTATGELKLCNIDSLFSTDEARKSIGKAISDLKLGKESFYVTIEPTDAILSDTSGRIDILGDDVSYNGLLILEGKPPEVLNGKAPASIIFTEKLLYAKIQTDKALAICENGKLISDSSNLYEYSPYPLPWRAVQAVGMAGFNLKPTINNSGLLLPRFMVKARIKKEEVTVGE